jgi:DNA-binding transcriptional MerR regulator
MLGVNSKSVANALRAMETELPAIPVKRYFTIGEVGELCGVKPHVLRYWEQEFSQLRPMKRRGNRRYYQHHEVLMIRRIRELLYEQGFTISGARNRLQDLGSQDKMVLLPSEPVSEDSVAPSGAVPASGASVQPMVSALVRQELLEIRNLLSVGLEKAEFDAII